MRPLQELVILCVLATSLAGCLVGEKPTQGDADGDFLEDSLETNGWNITVRLQPRDCLLGTPASSETRHVTSNPHEVDSDFDGVLDTDEYFLQSDPRSQDTDGDGLTDGWERQVHLDRSLYDSFRLKLWDADSDDDCLKDGDEVHGLLVPGLGIRSTDPTDENTDRDGWSDWEEIFIYKTDPTKADTDGDGAEDSLDVDPLHDVYLRLNFTNLLVKSGSGAFNVSFRYDMGGVNRTGRNPSPAREATVQAGVNTTLPESVSPGRVNVEDARGTGKLPVEFFLIRRDNNTWLNVNPADPGHAVDLLVSPLTRRWEVGPYWGNATGEVSVLETPQARLEFRLAVEYA